MFTYNHLKRVNYHFTNIKKITETEEVTVDLLKFKENVYDKIKETLTEKQKRKLTRIEGIIGRMVNIKESPVTTSTEESCSDSASSSNPSSKTGAEETSKASTSDLNLKTGAEEISKTSTSDSTSDLNHKLPKPKRKEFAELFFRIIGQQLPKLCPNDIGIHCESILRTLDIPRDEYYSKYGYWDPLM